MRNASAGRRRWVIAGLLVVMIGAAMPASGALARMKGAVATGGTLTIAYPSGPSTLDPGAGANAQGGFKDLAYDPLIVLAPDGTFKPGLALSWKYGPRNKSFSIKLRPGVRFSDGGRLTAAAVKTWIEHTLQVQGGSAKSYLGALKSIDVTGPLSLTFTFTTPTPLLQLVFSQVLEIGEVGSPKAVAANTLATATAGAGPYKLDTGATVTGDHYTYVPNPYYWNRSAIHYKKVVVRVLPNPASTLQALQTGQVQVAADQPVTSIGAAKSAHLKFVAPLTLYLGLNLIDRNGALAKPLGDARVRQALNYGIDRKAITKVVGAGYGRPITQMAVPGDDSYDPGLETAYTYNPTRAKQLLAAAGYPNGFTLSTLSLTVVQEDTVAQAMAGQLAQIGVKLDLDTKTDVGDYFGNFLGGKFPAATIAFGRLPAVVNYQLLYGPTALFNPLKAASTDLSRLYYKLIAAPGPQAAAIARQMQQLLVEQAWFVPVVATPLVVLYRPGVAGVNATTKRNVVYFNEIRPGA
jgi:peptide/nickel transport system substrate-binding protein